MSRLLTGVLAAAALTILPLTGAVGAPPAPAARPDLTVSALSSPPSKAEPGDAFTVTATVANRGDATAGASTTAVFLSKDRTKGPGDVRLASTTVKALKPGATTRLRTRVTLPRSTKAGTYHVLACADDRARVREARESDNCRSSATKVKVSVRLVGDLSGTLTFSDVGDVVDHNDWHNTWDRSVEVRVRMTVRGPLLRETFADDGSSYGWVGLEEDHHEDSSCVTHVRDVEEGAGGFAYSGDPWTDEIHGYFGHVSRKELSLGLHINYEHTSTRTQTGRGDYPCDDHQTVAGPTPSLNVNDLQLRQVSRTTSSITYRVVSWLGPQSTRSDWDSVEGRLVLDWS
jgi:hypothetical protein